MSEISRVSLIMDLAALFILLGLIHYTSIYRKRGKTEDRLFFAMSLIAGLMAVSDGVSWALSGISEYAGINAVLITVFFTSLQIICGLMGLYFMQKVAGEKKISGVKSFVMIIPSIAGVLFVISNYFTGLAFHIDRATNTFVNGPRFGMIFITVAIYSILTSIMIFKLRPGAILYGGMLVAVRIFMAMFQGGVSSTALLMVVGLLFIHLHVMGDSFYEEEKL